MKYQSGFGRRGGFGLKPAHWALVVSSVAAAGCSADVTRFDSASFSLNDPPQTTASVEQKSGTDFANPVTRSQRPGPYGAGLGSRAGGIESEPLPDATPAAAPLPPAAPPATAAMAPRASQPFRPAATQVAMAATPAPISAAGPGETIEVQPGDTLYRLSRKHQVSLDALMSVNGLTTPNLKPGQKLVLPSASATGMGTRTPAVTPAVMPQAAPQAAPAVAAPPAVSQQAEAKYDGTYTVQPGDSIYAIARKHKVAFTELQQVNGIVDPLKVRPGVVLKVPAAGGTAPAAAPQPIRTAAVSEAPAAQPAAATATPAASMPAPSDSLQPTVINAAKPADTAVPLPPSSDATNPAKGDKVALATPPPAKAAVGDTSKLRWPAQGKIIAGFGGRPDGTHNDGINLSVPLGTDVHAAESGVVAYAGSELKGYGNLVLLRHDNGWVTAYAHNEELLVKRGEKVSRGQVIAKAGKTGTVDQPQIHFELRQGSKPVDPTPFMEKL